jgi:H+/Cl- antiporter ClcA
MIGIIAGSLVSYLVWTIRQHEAYFLVFYVSKGFNSLQFFMFIAISVSFYGRVLKLLNVQLNKIEKIPSYLTILALLLCIVLIGISDSGETFYLYGKYNT